jgi:Holliday junction resolvase
MMSPADIAKIAFLLYPYITRTELDSASVESLAAKMRDLHKGLSPEDEFAAKVCWLGNCAAIHRIDQTPMKVTEVDGKMRAPDFIAFPIVNGQPFPVLIEVKSHFEDKLDFSESYLNSLCLFADRMKLPLLIAWRHGAIWSLFDHNEIKKNITAYRITFERAMRQDLSCVLFRELRIQMNPALELILDMDLLDEAEGDANTLLPTGQFRFRIRDAGFYDNGVHIPKYKPLHFSLFMATPDETEFRRTGKRTFQQIYRPQKDHGLHLSNVLVAQLSMSTGQNTEINWHDIVTKALPSSGRELRESLQSAIDIGFVRYVLDIVPNDWPDFLRHMEHNPQRENVV